MAAPSSGEISIGDICDEAVVYKDGITFPTQSRASLSRFQNDVSCVSYPNPQQLSNYYGYIHPVIASGSISVGSINSTNRFSYIIRIDESVANSSRNRTILPRLRFTYQIPVSSSSVVTGNANIPNYIDPDSVVFGTLGDPFPSAESLVFQLPSGTTQKTFEVTFPKTNGTYDVFFDIIRTKGQITDDKYKIVDNTGTSTDGGSGITRYTLSIPSAPLVYAWASTDDGTLTANPCSALSLNDTVYIRERGGTISTGGDPQAGDEIYSNNDINNLIPWQTGRYAFERNGNRFNVLVNTAGIIGSVLQCV